MGMGRELCEAYPPARALFERAGKLLDLDLARVCLEGPQEELDRTDVCQPALLVTALAALKYYQSKNNTEAAACAGLSLGEYTALVHAGVIDFETAVRLLQHRGRWMQEDCEREPSGMASVLGLPPDRVREACEEAAGVGVVAISNLNGPGQVVISGIRTALEKASDLCRARGARRVIPLRVAGAYHSPVMARAAEKMRALLEETPFQRARIPVVSNVDGRFRTEAADIKQALQRQMTSPVLWEASMRSMIEAGIRTFVEFGPGGVLTGLAKKIDPGLVVRCVQGPGDL